MWFRCSGARFCCAHARHSLPSAPVAAGSKPADAQHAGITTPHGDHSPHHGGIVLMNGEMHYEVVFDPAGKHRVWFSNAVREDLPASIATGVAMVMIAADGRRRKRCPSGSTTAARAGSRPARPLDESGTMVKLTYSVRGEPFEIEIPFSLTLAILIEMKAMQDVRAHRRQHQARGRDEDHAAVERVGAGEQLGGVVVQRHPPDPCRRAASTHSGTRRPSPSAQASDSRPCRSPATRADQHARDQHVGAQVRAEPRLQLMRRVLLRRSDGALLIPERIDRIEPRGATRRVVAEQDADGGGDAERRRQRRSPKSPSASRAPPSACGRSASPTPTPMSAADQAHHHRFDQELHQHVAPPGADGEAQGRSPWSARSPTPA